MNPVLTRPGMRRLKIVNVTMSTAHATDSANAKNFVKPGIVPAGAIRMTRDTPGYRRPGARSTVFTA